MSPASTAVAGSREPLHESLLHAAPAASERRPLSRWSYPLWGIVLVSVFVLFHVSVLLVWNAPGKGLAKQFHKSFLEQVNGYEYFRGTRNNQSWAMFAPNPNRTNAFVFVYVEDQAGEMWDFEQDIWAENRYPYFWYDRRGKINRRIDGKKHYQRLYGAWVCREWQRRNGGELPKSVTFIRRWTRVPHPGEVFEKGSWDQWEAPYKQIEQETITCKTVVHGQLPNELRARYGLEPIDEDEEFRPVRSRTWWDRLEAEREREDREAKRAEVRERWDSEREDRADKRREPPRIDPRGPLRDPDDEPGNDEESPDQ